MDQYREFSLKHYYDILGVTSDASPCAIRAAYKKLAMRWHPDKCSDRDRAEAKTRFQEIQEAYAVLSDERKKMLYDNGLYDADDDDDEIEGLSSFLNEMTDLMANVQASEGTEKCESLEDLQKLFVSMFSADLAALGNAGPTASSNFDKKRDRGCSNYGTSFLDSYILEQNISSPQLYFNGNIGNEIDLNTSSSKKTRCNNNGLNPSAFG